MSRPALIPYRTWLGVRFFFLSLIAVPLALAAVDLGQNQIVVRSAKTASHSPATQSLDGGLQIAALDGTGESLNDGRANAAVASLFLPAVTYESGATGAYSVAVAGWNGGGKLDRAIIGLSNTSVVVTSNHNPAQPKQRVDYTAAITTESGGPATGTVTFFDGNTSIGTSQVFFDEAGAGAKFTKEDVGSTHPITAVYSGDANNDPSTSPVFTEFVKFKSTMEFHASPNPSLVGQAVTFTVGLESHGGPVQNGDEVDFYDSKVFLGSALTSPSPVSFTTSSLSAKKHTIQVRFLGDSRSDACGSGFTVVVNKYTTSETLVSNPNPSSEGQPVTFTATVTPSGAVAPTGKVKFLDGTKSLGEAMVVGGVATFTKPKLAVGTHAITAEYLGDDVNGEGLSPVVDQVVNP